MNVVSRQRGMTLIEAMVALALLSLLSVGIVSAFRFAELSYRQIVRVNSASRDIVTAQRFLRSVLESAYPFDASVAAGSRAFGFEGALDSLALTAPMPVASGAAGHRRFEIVLRPGNSGLKDLIVRSSIDRNGASGPAQEEVLIEGVESVQWAYLEPVETNEMRNPSGAQWLDDWRAARKPPRLVRLQVFFPPGDSRLWPELIVESRITDDANCEFDVVAQDCREAQS